MLKIDTIISPKWLITVDPKNRVLNKYSLVVFDDKIHDILPTDEALQRYEGEHVQLTDHIVCPGLINAHTHMSMNLLRGFADDLPLMEWLEQHIWPAESKWLGEEFVADGTRLAIAEALLGGTTCFNDMYFFPDVTARIASNSRIRACIGLIVLEFPTAWANNAEEYISKALKIQDEFRHDPLVSTALAPHAPYTVSSDTLSRINTLSAELDIPVHIHLHETAEEVAEFKKQHGISPIQSLHEIGLLNPSLIAVHMTQLTDDEITLLAQAGVNIVHCPESNMKLASGGCPVHELHKRGINVALGTDSTASNNDLDMLGEMKSAALLGKYISGDAAAVNASQTLRMATINGAIALNLQDTTGSLEVGKAADIIAVNTAKVNMAPVYEPVSHLVYSASRDCVDHVWVAGKQLVKNGSLLYMNEQEIYKSAQKWLNRIQQD